MSNYYSGSCPCGNSKIEVDKDVQPTLQVFCHCKYCTRSHSSCVVPAICFTQDSVKNGKIRIIGKEGMSTFNATPKITRYFCKTCGSPIFMEVHAIGGIATFSPLLADFPYQPTCHFHYASKTLSIKDGLPKYADVPAEFGGSGQILSD